MIDFCYFFNVATWLHTYLCMNKNWSDKCEAWSRVNFILAMGPSAFGIGYVHFLWSKAYLRMVQVSRFFVTKILPKSLWHQNCLKIHIREDKWVTLTSLINVQCTVRLFNFIKISSLYTFIKDLYAQ